VEDILVLKERLKVESLLTRILHSKGRDKTVIEYGILRTIKEKNRASKFEIQCEVKLEWKQVNRYIHSFLRWGWIQRKYLKTHLRGAPPSEVYFLTEKGEQALKAYHNFLVEKIRLSNFYENDL
jgi:predicted transcriptional regulator